MKKIIFILLMCVTCTSLMAQVDVFKGSLEEALDKAAKESKQVVAMVSTTWCGPCKAFVANAPPEAKLGDYMNPRYVFLKYNIDEADPDEIDATYGVDAFPTFLILDTNGNEIVRYVGGASVDAFIERLETSSENPIIALRENYAADPQKYGEEYLQELLELYDNRKAAAVLDNMFGYMAPDVYFEKYFSRANILDNNSDAVKYMLANSEEMRTAFGEKYTTAMSGRGQQWAFEVALEDNNAKRDEGFAKFSAFVGKNGKNDPLKTGEDDPLKLLSKKSVKLLSGLGSKRM